MNTPSKQLLAVTPFLVVALLLSPPSASAAPQWIWSAGVGGAKADEVLYFRKGFEVAGEVSKAELFVSCDNSVTVWINGKRAAASEEWAAPAKEDVRSLIVDGRNTIAARGVNDGSNTAGLVARLVVTSEGGETTVVESDASWRIATERARGWRTSAFDDSGWRSAVVAAPLGSGPWGDIGSGRKGGGSAPAALSAAAVVDGFEAQLLYRVPKAEQGSWVALALDPKGRLIASDQGNAGLFRITVTDSPDGTAQASVEKVDVDVSGAQGLVWAFGGLYAHISGKELVHITDGDGDDRLDTVARLGGPDGGGEHGNHAVIVSEDGKALYVAAGNHTNTPDAKITGSRLPRNWDEDLLLPRQWDARGHARGRLAPGGWVARVSPDSTSWEIVSIGYRNQYDIAINRHGDMFTYDADMEWDMGMPWYRPTRICHVVSGSDFGWRSGTGKWPEHFEDTLPATVDIGPGSPTGVVFGAGAKFPARYQDALYALDWTFGTIWAVHLEEVGAGYAGTSEPFVTGAPLPVTDAVVGGDGALYFTVGGRGAQSALYRVVYRGDESTDPASGGDPGAAQARQLRRRLEAFHGVKDSAAVDAAWPHLGSGDRFVRHAARVAIESQPAGWWAGKLVDERDPQARITAAVALARAGTGDERYRGQVLDALLGLDASTLGGDQLAGMLRGYALAFMRLGRPDEARRRAIIGQIDPLLPGDSDAANLELVRVLVFLDAPGVVPKALGLMLSGRPQDVPAWGEVIQRNRRYGGTIQKMLDDPPPTRELAYAFLLRNVRYGWSLDERKKYFKFINEAAKRPGGASYSGFLENMRSDALANCSAAERAALAGVTGESLQPPAPFTVEAPAGPGRAWTLSEAVATVDGQLSGRNFARGQNLFHAVACATCHRFDGVGGAIGPDVSTVRNKFSPAELLESIIEPSKVISDQYGSSKVTLKTGESITGLVVEKGDGGVEVYPPDPSGVPVVVGEDAIRSVEAVPISQMPPGLVNSLNADELRDLVAYLMSRGNPDDPMFRQD